jgi:hypothetical protein
VQPVQRVRLGQRVPGEQRLVQLRPLEDSLREPSLASWPRSGAVARQPQ